HAARGGAATMTPLAANLNVEMPGEGGLMLSTKDFGMAAIVLAVSCSCRNQPVASPGTTQPGAANPDKKGGSIKDTGCQDVPAADRLKELLKQAPALGEAGG